MTPGWSRDHDWRGPAAISLVSLVACIAGIQNLFVQDDVALIANNANVHQLNLALLFSSSFWPAPFSQDLYRPLTSTLLAVEYAIGGGGPLLFRIVSILLYAAVVVLLVRMLRSFVSPTLALVAVALFAAHLCTSRQRHLRLGKLSRSRRFFAGTPPSDT